MQGGLGSILNKSAFALSHGLPCCEHLPALPPHLQILTREQHLDILPAGIDDPDPPILVSRNGEICRVRVEAAGRASIPGRLVEPGSAQIFSGVI